MTDLEPIAADPLARPPMPDENAGGTTFAALAPPDEALLAQGTTGAPASPAPSTPAGELWSGRPPLIGGDLSVSFGYDTYTPIRTSSIGAFGFSISQPAEVIDPPGTRFDDRPAVGPMAPGFEDSPTYGGAIPDKIVAAIPYVGPALAALPGDNVSASVGVELRDGTNASGDPTNELHLKAGIVPAEGEIDFGKVVKDSLGKTLKEVPIHPEVREAIEEQIGGRLGALKDMKGPDGKPLLTADGKLKANAGISLDFIVETDKANPLKVESVEVFVGLSGSGSIGASGGFGVSTSQGLSAVAGAQVSAKWEADPDTAPPTVVPVRDQFVRLNGGDTGEAYAITEELLDGKASVRYPQGGVVQHGVKVADETSVWDLSAVSAGRNHGHPALEVANSVNEVLRREGAIGPSESIGSTERAGQLLREVYADADPATQAELVADVANPIGLNFGIEAVGNANAGLEASNGSLPDAEAFRQRFLSTNVYY